MTSRAERFWKWVGGRKQLNAYLFATLATFMAFKLDATFDAYALWLAAALLGTSAIVAIEDRKASRPFGRRRAADAQPVQEAS